MSDISNRKKEHLDLANTISSQSQVSPGWEDVELVPASIPTIGPADVDLSIQLLDHRLAAPFVIASMTGGHPEAIVINENLALAAQELGIAIGSGSQRAALRDATLAGSFEVIRKAAPDAIVMANIGVCQLIDQGGIPALSRAEVMAAVEMIEAQMLIVHLNAVEEMIQPEGDQHLSGLLEALERVVASSTVPVMAKETGSGMSRATAEALAAVGVSALDVGGAGGTSFARIEGMRAEARGDALRTRLGSTFADWGIPTAASVIETRDVGLPVVATGGIRTGLHAAKAIALGAHAVGLGRPVLAAAQDSPEAVVAELTAFIEELKIAIVLTGGSKVGSLREADLLITGRTGEWMNRERN